MITRRKLVGGTLAAGLVFTLLSGRRAASADTRSAALPKTFAEIEARIGGRLGVTVRRPGSDFKATHRGDERFPMCSTFKLLAVAAVLKSVDEGKEDLTREILVPADEILDYAPVTEKHAGNTMTLLDLCAATMVWSDNTAANLILSSLGGPAAATAFVRSLGDNETRIDRMEPDANDIRPGDPRDTTTPNAMTDDLDRLIIGDVLSAGSRTQLTDWLLANETGKTRLRAGLPKTWRVGDRTGTGPLGTSNDVGVAFPPEGTPILISAFLTGSPAGREERDVALAEVGHAVAAAIG